MKQGSGGAAILTSVVQGSYEIGVSGSTPAIVAASKGLPITIIAGDTATLNAIRVPERHNLPLPLLEHVLDTHVLVDEVGAIAQAAGVPKLVLSHTVDFGGPINRGEWRRLAQDGYGGEVEVGVDLMTISVA